MAFYSPFFPVSRRDQSPLDVFDDHPLLHFGSSAFRDAVNATRSYNRANVSETGSEYKLEIEVPGYQKSEISLEYGQDGRTLIVSGRKEESFEQSPETETETVDAPKPVTVEDAPEEGEKPTSEAATTSTAVAETKKEDTVGNPAAPKYWISERSVGAFQRSFSLPPRLDLAKATASLEHGVLTVVIPKAAKQQVRSIAIS
jgi:HSP20 family molecular chaperone IbpA